MQTRNTVQLDIVRASLCQLANHPTADEVYANVHTAHPIISKATVYRALNKLAAQGFALKIATPFGPDRFDHQTHTHAHAQCSVCGKVADVTLNLPAGAVEAAAAETSFDVQSVNVVFTGTCPECLQQQ